MSKSSLLLALSLTYGAGRSSAAQPACEESVIRDVDRAEADREAYLNGYSVTERYTVRNARFKTAAEMVVATVYRKGTGKSYQVLSRSGSASLHASVFERLLKAQVEMSQVGTRGRALITSNNYHMKLLGDEVVDGRACHILDLVPRTKNSHLLKGRAWVDAEDHSLVRVEGKPNSSPSFWTGRPQIVREYQRINGFAEALKTHATTDSLFLGKSELTIEYSDYTVDCGVKDKLNALHYCR